MAKHVYKGVVRYILSIPNYIYAHNVHILPWSRKNYQVYSNAAILNPGAEILKVETPPILRTAEMIILKTTILQDINK